MHLRPLEGPKILQMTPWFSFWLDKNSLYKVLYENLFHHHRHPNCLCVIVLEDKFGILKLGQTHPKKNPISFQDDIYNRPRLPPPTRAPSWFFFKIVLLVAGNVGSLVLSSPKCLSSWLPLVSFSSVTWSQLSKRHYWEQRKREQKFPLLPLVWNAPILQPMAGMDYH